MRLIRTILIRILAVGLILSLGLWSIAILQWPGDPDRSWPRRIATAPIRAFNHLRPHLNFGNGSDCLARLPQLGVNATPVADRSTSLGCRLKNAVLVRRIDDVTLSRPAIMTCRLATLLARHLRKSVQPAAQAHLGSEVRGIVHYGTYNCRTMRGSAGLLSEHAYANAIDVAAYRLADGRQVTLQRDWQTPAQESAARFLHQVAEGACRHFSATLTPDSNARHHDHFHLDAGVFRHCGL